MQRAFLFLLVVASALCLASAQISTSNLPTVGQTSNDVEVAAVEPRWVDKNKCTKPGTYWPTITSSTRCVGASKVWKYQMCWKNSNLKLACKPSCHLDESVPGCVPGAPKPFEIVWVNRTGSDPGFCNDTCSTYGRTRYNESNWQGLLGPANLTATQQGTFAWSGLCRRNLNGQYLGGYDLNGTIIRSWAPVVCMFYDPVKNEGAAAGSHFECACARGCATPDCGIWKQSKVCSCNSGCQCGAMFPKDFRGFDWRNDYLAVGMTPKGDAGKCTFNDPWGPDAGQPNYAVFDTLVMGGCVGLN